MTWRFVALCFVASITCAQSQKNQSLRIPRVTKAPTIEDYLHGAPREKEAVVTGFVQNSPGDGKPATEETTAYLSYDESNLYIAFVCKAPPKELRARYARREDLFPDDMVGVNVDTWHDRQRSFFFYSNPHGIQLDGIHTEGQGDDSNWDTVWHSEGRITAVYAQTWGIILGRHMPRKNEFVWWPYLNSKISSFVPQFATLEGLEDISPARNLQLNPYLNGLRSTTFQPITESVHRGRVGIDGKAVIKDSFTFDFTANPDFSQVESDEPQVTLNQRFEVQFPERRPFFLENASFFNTPQNLFFSRRIADPGYGARLTGKANGWAVGLLSTNDRSTGSDGNAQIFAGRVKREFRKDSNVGFLITDREHGANSNRVFSADTRLRFNKNLTFNGQAAASEWKKASGYLADAKLNWNGRHLGAGLRYEDISPEFFTQLGFVPRTDIRRFTQEMNYSFRRDDGGNLVSYGPGIVNVAIWNHAGRLTDWRNELAYAFEFRGTTFLELGHTEAGEFYQGIDFRKRSNAIGLFSERFKRVGLRAGWNIGDEINFDLPKALPLFLQNRRRQMLLCCLGQPTACG